MDRDELIKKAIKPLTKMYNRIEQDLLNSIAENFNVNQEFINSDIWRIEKLKEMGVFNRNTVEYLAKQTGKTNEEISKALNTVADGVVTEDTLKEAYTKRKLLFDPERLKENPVIQSIIENEYNETTKRFIEMSDQIAAGTKKAYLDIVEEGFLKTSMGTHSYQEAIKSAIDKLAERGIRTVNYRTESGKIRSYSIEGMVRREILTATRRVGNEMTLKLAEEIGADKLILSEHLECRPDHFPWQGTIIKREDLVKVTDYGSITGLGGINCRHYFDIYTGTKTGKALKKITKKQAEKAYKESQHQRYLERGIRKWKRQQQLYEEAGDKVSTAAAKVKKKEWQNRLKAYLKKTKRRRDLTREYTVAESQKVNNKIQ